MGEIAVNVSELSWEAAENYPSGTQRKVLRRGSENEPTTVLLKLPAGFEMKDHAHIYVEHHYILEGEYESMGKKYPAGFYRRIPAHTGHGPFRSESGALILVLWEE